MSRVAEFIANDLKFCDVRLGPFRSDVGSFPGLWHRGLGILIIVFNTRSLGGASVGYFICHIREPARATMASTAVPIVQGWLDRGVD